MKALILVLNLILSILIFLSILIIIFLINFYKDPKRKIPKGNNIVSPADGKVISIIETNSKNIQLAKGLLGEIKTLTNDVAQECYVISIFMSPFDAHINRSPIKGIVKSVRYTEGKFYRAYDLGKSFCNEKNEIVIQNRKIKLKVIQIAGFLARRIGCDVKVNEKVNKGNKIGMIALGSRTMLIIPKNKVILAVKMGDKVEAGSSIIGYLR